MTITDDENDKLVALWRALLHALHERLTNGEQEKASLLNVARLFLADNGIVLTKHGAARIALRNLIDLGATPFPARTPADAHDEHRDPTPERIAGLPND
jgi:hypothetical protein